VLREGGSPRARRHARVGARVVLAGSAAPSGDSLAPDAHERGATPGRLLPTGKTGANLRVPRHHHLRIIRCLRWRACALNGWGARRGSQLLPPDGGGDGGGGGGGGETGAVLSAVLCDDDGGPLSLLRSGDLVWTVWLPGAPMAVGASTLPFSRVGACAATHPH